MRPPLTEPLTETPPGERRATVGDDDWRCHHSDPTHRRMNSSICSYRSGCHQNPCWCHNGICSYFIGKDGVYEFTSFDGQEKSVEICAEPWTCKPDRHAEERVIYVESSLDGINWDVLYKKQYNPAKEWRPVNFSLPSPKRLRFIRGRMPPTESHTGLCGYLDHFRFSLNESKVKDIQDEGVTVSRVTGEASFHRYRNCSYDKGIVQVSYDGTSDWETVGKFDIPGLNQRIPFDFSAPNKKIRFVRVLAEPGCWRYMPITPLVINHSNISIQTNQGTVERSCKNGDHMEAFFPGHPCVSMDTMENYWNWYQSGGFRHTYPLLGTAPGPRPGRDLRWLAMLGTCVGLAGLTYMKPQKNF